jgi:8-oxo-dGTP diphosphatase
VFEETGWRITQPRVFFRFKVFSFMPDYDLWAEKICTIYVAHPVYQKSAPSEPDHHPVILPADAALNHLASPGDRQAVAQFFGKR